MYHRTTYSSGNAGYFAGLASEVCYDQVGCFTDEEPFRRSYLPESRQIINVTYSLFVRQEPPDEANPYFRTVNVSGPHLQAHETEMESTWKRLLRPTQTTKMIVHDFGDSGELKQQCFDSLSRSLSIS